ncbi:phosphate acyltransferase [Rickettsiales bacterium]|nr:phosphate acyltransferase [Rickettsiales bacterium]
MGNTVIALDAMGGDNAPDIVVHGAAKILRKRNDVKFLLYGDEQRLAALIDKHGITQRNRLDIVHTSLVIGSDAKPSLAFRKHKGSSMHLAISAIAEGKAAGMVSAGNTGALMVISRFALGVLPGVKRPAIITYIPTMHGASVMLDLGANVDCDSQELMQFAIMGSAFASLSKDNPSVALLNIGSEDTKGNRVVKDANSLLQSCNINFQGYIEANEIMKGKIDVIVCDGFVGNIALKMAEGTLQFFGRMSKRHFSRSWLSKLGALVAGNGLKQFAKMMDIRTYDGAMLLGLNGVVVKSHGSGDGVAFASSIEVALDAISNGVSDKIVSKISNV